MYNNADAMRRAQGKLVSAGAPKANAKVIPCFCTKTNSLWVGLSDGGSTGEVFFGGLFMSATEKDSEIVFSEETVAAWKEGVLKRREELFRRNWKNRRANPNLRSRQDEKGFQFVLEWYEDFGEVVQRERERNRLDKLLAKGLDVNDPKNRED
jgi:hypothetical protein